MLEPSGGQRIRIATAIVACPAALTSDMKCRSAGARSLASRNAWPIGTTRSGCAARSRAGPAKGLNIWLAMPTRIRRFPDLTLQAAMISLPTSCTNSSSSAPAAIRMRPARSTVHSALAAGFAPDGLLSAQLPCPLLL